MEQDAAGGLAVATGAPGLLNVVLERAGDVGVDDETNVGLVDPHAEGVRCRYDAEVAVREPLLRLQLGFRPQSRMVVAGRVALLLQEDRHPLGRASRRAIDDRA